MTVVLPVAGQVAWAAGSPAVLGSTGTYGTAGASNAGAVVRATSTTSGTTLQTFPVSGPAAAGSLVVASICVGALNSPTVSAVTDSKGNTWTVAATAISGTTVRVALAYSVLTTALALGDSVTVALSAASPRWVVVADAFTGIIAAPLDKTATNTGTSTTPSSGTTATTTQAAELVVAAFATADATWTVGGSDTLAGTRTTAAGSSERQAVLQYRVVSSTGAQSSTGSLSSSVAWAGAVATFKAVVNTGGSSGYPVKVWNGASWVTRPMKAWVGGAWRNAVAHREGTSNGVQAAAGAVSWPTTLHTVTGNATHTGRVTGVAGPIAWATTSATVYGRTGGTDRRIIFGSSHDQDLAGWRTFDTDLARAGGYTGRVLQARRCYNQLGDMPATFAASNAAQHPSLGIHTVISFKTDRADMANGLHDDWLAGFVRSCPTAYSTYIAWWHEPEPNNAALFRAGFARFAKVLIATRGSRPVYPVLCTTSYTHRPASGRDWRDWTPTAELLARSAPPGRTAYGPTDLAEIICAPDGYADPATESVESRFDLCWEHYRSDGYSRFGMSEVAVNSNDAPATAATWTQHLGDYARSLQMDYVCWFQSTRGDNAPAPDGWYMHGDAMKRAYADLARNYGPV